MFSPFSIPSPKRALENLREIPGFGAEAMTTRGCSSADFQKIADFLDRCCKIALKAWDRAEKSRSKKNGLW